MRQFRDAGSNADGTDRTAYFAVLSHDSPNTTVEGGYGNVRQSVGRSLLVGV